MTLLERLLETVNSTQYLEKVSRGIKAEKKHYRELTKMQTPTMDEMTKVFMK